MAFFQQYNGWHIENGVLHIHETGAEVPMNKAFWQDLRAVLVLNIYLFWLKLYRALRGHRPVAKMAFHPQPAGPWYNAWLAAKAAGIKVIKDPAGADRLFYFDDATIIEKGASSGLAAARMQGRHPINSDVTDISKSAVARTFEAVFGYSVHVDPTRHQGPAVCKSEKNGTHDGVIVNCPLASDEVRVGYSYQKLVDSTFSGRSSEDLRLALVGGEIAVVYHKHKPLDNRFGKHYLSVDLRQAEDVFSVLEIQQIQTFSDRMNLEFGAIDVLRDKHDGRIYIVDVNKTCMPVLSLGLKDQMTAMRKIGEAMTKSFCLSGEMNSTEIERLQSHVH